MRMFVTFPDPRHTVTEQGDGLVLRIPSKRNVLLVVVLSFLLCIWLVGEIPAPAFLLQSLFQPPTFATIIQLSVGAWTVGGGCALYIWLWQMKGFEIITVSPTTLVIKRAIFGWGRSRCYDVAGIRQFRVVPFDTLTFDYGRKTIRFGSGVGETEARFILLTLTSRVPGLAAAVADKSSERTLDFMITSPQNNNAEEGHSSAR